MSRQARAFSNRSRTRDAPTPTKSSTNSDAAHEKKGVPASPATALASNVLPACQHSTTEIQQMLERIQTADNNGGLGCHQPGGSDPKCVKQMKMCAMAAIRDGKHVSRHVHYTCVLCSQEPSKKALRLSKTMTGIACACPLTQRSNGDTCQPTQIVAATATYTWKPEPVLQRKLRQAAHV